MDKISLTLSKDALKAGKLMAGFKGVSFSRFVNDLIIKNFNAEEIKTTASDISRNISAGGKDIKAK